MRSRLVATAALAFAASASLGVTRPDDLGDVVAVQHWSYPTFSRVVIQISEPADAIVGEVPADPDGEKPARLFFDVPGMWAGRRFETPIRVGDGLLRQIRVGQNTLDTARVVLDLERYGRHRVLQLAAPARIVIDVFAPQAAAGERSTPKRQPEHGSDSLPMELRPVRVVVVDAGHGGRDPGALGIGGVREKDVTLALAKILRKSLHARGFEVVLTRDRDRTLSLEERTAIAEGSGGDVFVSVHANASPRAELAGVELFTLQENAERQTLRLAARENGVAPAEVDPLQRLLARLRLSEAGARSTLLAKQVHHEIAAGMGERWPSTREPVLKQGPFYVLYLSDMPALLVEAGFVTHREDARRLRDPEYLRAMADEIASGVGRFRDKAAPLVAEAHP
ncbi:MAG: N-acetylmuramoyl-L-alanine amidase [Proteobacteria bacterium]|nr:N-acetylmuramoyl-L-alanine amidase [Pseudomonadota bacterium]